MFLRRSPVQDLGPPGPGSCPLPHLGSLCCSWQAASVPTHASLCFSLRPFLGPKTLPPPTQPFFAADQSIHVDFPLPPPSPAWMPTALGLSAVLRVGPVSTIRLGVDPRQEPCLSNQSGGFLAVALHVFKICSKEQKTLRLNLKQKGEIGAFTQGWLRV